MAAISELLRTPVTRARLVRWLADNQGLLEAAGSGRPAVRPQPESEPRL